VRGYGGDLRRLSASILVVYYAKIAKHHHHLFIIIITTVKIYIARFCKRIPNALRVLTYTQKEKIKVLRWRLKDERERLLSLR